MKEQRFLSEMSEDELLQLTEQEIDAAVGAERLYFNSLPHKKYLVATHGARTQQGGLVRAIFNHKYRVNEHLIAVVGDEVLYEDGTYSTIISGSGEAGILFGHSMALVGSKLENGDEIIETPQTSLEIRIYEHLPVPRGFLSDSKLN